MNSLKQLAGSLKTDMVLDWSNSLLEETQGKLLLGALHYDVTGPLMSRLGPRAVLAEQAPRIASLAQPRSMLRAAAELLQQEPVEVSQAEQEGRAEQEGLAAQAQPRLLGPSPRVLAEVVAVPLAPTGTPAS